MTMSVAKLKEQIHAVIEGIQNQESFEIMLTMAKSKCDNEMYPLTAEDLIIVKGREEKFQRGEMKIDSLEEMNANSKAKYGFSF